MKYNLSAFKLIFDHTIPSYLEWREAIHSFFYNEKHDPVLLDEYYDILISDIRSIYELVRKGHLVEDHSGLFTFDNPEMKGLHTFNMGNMIRRNVPHFHKKKLRTVTSDYGMLNVQIQLCGLDLAGTTILDKNKAGAVLAVIGNKCRPYTFNDTVDCDTIFVCNVFEEQIPALQTWKIMEENHKHGREVFFTSHTFTELHNFVKLDRIEQVENPVEIYDKDVYSNLDLGLSNKIYRMV